MCEFKVGDVVRRIIVDNKPAAKIGTIATVVSVDNGRDGVMDVTYGNVASEMWFQDRAELVERKQEKPAPYQFAVGDKGKTRDGRSYEVLAVGVKGLAEERSIVVIANGYAWCLRSDGREYDTRNGSCDLMPPTKTMWRVELTGVKDPKTSGLLDMTSTRYYDTEENAHKGIARGVRSYITVKGPFPEEREA